MSKTAEILNWHRWTPHITLSGQPTEDQLAALRDSGVTHIINLGPHTNKGALADEPGTVAGLGMAYIHIPVDFSAPTDQDFAAFCEQLDALDGETIHVHCIYNARVSAFIYKRAKDGLGGSEDDALALMDKVWRPGGVWASFIGNDADATLPHRYAGHDY